ncbi:Kip operon repressor protein [Thalassovita gelatinovora]|uniref:Kip operon repressor protein n=1 Tax=Thalassovita gelatinovora TaxID=53501 RepID=A0A0N7LUU9_THAGE|nr:IclR family transcriptional regulator [Thalassovita gelatinovora]QIZ81323.1 IclR family transcriptional regulator [Thalassovita gelatinovora]CUH64506.1 Kip operon repressor protein [Thalassovita gelatinovora]SEP97305.1 transcriptional regulator, IclR family [Thalassovita gelatinovora]
MGTITKALELLNQFSSTRSEIGLGEFVRLCGRDKATVHRHLSELEENGFLEQDPSSRAYRLGPALLRLSAVREAAFPVRSLLRPIVVELAETVGELAHASLLQKEMLSPVFHADPRLHGTQVHFDESETLPLHATSSGLAVLTFAPETLRDQLLSQPLEALTSKTITDPTILQSMMSEVRGTGYSQLDSTFDQEVASQAAPLFGENGQVIGAIAVAVPLVRASSDRMRGITPKLTEAARAATRSLGGQYPDFPNAHRQIFKPTHIE